MNPDIDITSHGVQSLKRRRIANPWATESLCGTQRHLPTEASIISQHISLSTSICITRRKQLWMIAAVET